MNYDGYHSQKEQYSLFNIIKYIRENYIDMYSKLKKASIKLNGLQK